MTHLLFSYGTLQLEKVQLESFGRMLKGERDVLKGFRIEQIQIKDEAVLSKSEKEYHPIAVASNDELDQIEGMLYEITQKELEQADEYEVVDYKRVSACFESGKQAWIYIKR